VAPVVLTQFGTNARSRIGKIILVGSGGREPKLW